MRSAPPNTAPRTHCRKRRSPRMTRPSAGLAPRRPSSRVFGSAKREQSPLVPIATPSAVTHVETEEDNAVIYPLGAARAQVHDTFIIAETENSLVIVDQHAAHERLVYERLKRAFAGGLSRQMLLIPEVVELDAEAAGRTRCCGRRPRASRPRD